LLELALSPDSAPFPSTQPVDLGGNPNPQVDEFKFLWMVYISGFTQFSLFTHWVKVRFCLNWHYHRIQHRFQVPNLRIWGTSAGQQLMFMLGLRG
jgi:hypothetical protein